MAGQTQSARQGAVGNRWLIAAAGVSAARPAWINSAQMSAMCFTAINRIRVGMRANAAQSVVLSGLVGSS